MSEVWKDIPGYVGAYQVSSLGRVRSLDRSYPWRSRWGTMTIRTVLGAMLRTQYYPNQYAYVQLSIAGKKTPALIHRLVAMAFLGVPDNVDDMHVNHKNGIREANHVANLEWVTPSENHLHAYRCLPRKKHNLTIPVMIWKGGKFMDFPSCIAAAKYLGVIPASVKSALHRKHKCAGHTVERSYV